VAHRTPSQVVLRHRIEGLIGAAAPLLDLVLFAGDKVSRVAGRNDVDPDPPRRLRAGDRRRIAPPADHGTARR
jgi:hypothetical protein